MFDFFKKKEKKVKETKVTIQEDFNDVTPIADYFKGITGVTFDKQIGILKNKVTSFCKQRDMYSFSELLGKVKTDRTLKQELIDYLTTNETYFYREFKQIKELVDLVISTNKKVDILCAPCATGEEPYSIAIALLEAGINPNNFKITGIDINADAIKKANEATYKERNLRNLSAEITSKYFNHQDNLFTLKNSVKSHVDFTIANIFDDSFKHLGKFDFILSRNMLIYFDKKTKLKAKQILEDMLKDKSQKIFFGHADLF